MNWDNNQRNVFANEYVLTCKLYDKDISFDLAKLVIEDLRDLNAEDCFAAIISFRKNPKNKFWPKASDVRGIVVPEISDESLAEQAAKKIPEAIKKFGWPQPNEARAFIGEIGWSFIMSRGGWTNVCQNLGSEWDIGIFHAQARQVAKSEIEYRKFNEKENEFLFPPSRRNDDPGLISAGKLMLDIVKDISSDKKNDIIK
jgi:hypothetical protein